LAEGAKKLKQAKLKLLNQHQHHHQQQGQQEQDQHASSKSVGESGDSCVSTASTSSKKQVQLSAIKARIVKEEETKMLAQRAKLEAFTARTAANQEGARKA
jgi:DNA-binding protein YbaB